MFSILIFVLLISGSLFAAAFFNKKFEEIIPITCMGIVAVLFVFGLLGILEIGFYFVFATLISLIIAAVLRLIIRKNYYDFFKCIVTPAFFIFSLLFLIICICNKGIVASSWDEFSHWVDSVKAMFTINDFVTNPSANSMFKSYPPALALFQYFFTKVNSIISPLAGFVDEKVYIAHQIFAISFFFPFLKSFTFKRIGTLALSTIAIFCTPLLFFTSILSTVYIDPIISIIAGCTISIILFKSKNDFIYHLFVTLSAFTLVIVKDVGLLFACFICVFYIIKYISSVEITNNKVKHTIICFLPAIFTAISKLLWTFELRSSNVSISFDGSNINLLTYTKMFFTHNDNTYKQDVVESIKDAFFGNYLNVGNLSFSISYFNTLIIFIFIFAVIYSLYKNSLDSNKKKFTFKTILGLLILQTILYSYSLGATYISNFTEYEATQLASYGRYMNIAFLVLYIFITLSLVNYFKNNENRWAIAIITLFITLSTPFSVVKNYVNGNNVKKSIEAKKDYLEIINDINTNCAQDSKIWFVSQENSGYDYHITRYNVRPRVIDNLYSWSIGVPFYDGDMWTKEMSVDEFKDTLINNNYKYVAIYNTNDYFNQTYSSLFENPEEISNNSVFKLNSKTKVLERVDS